MSGAGSTVTRGRPRVTPRRCRGPRRPQGLGLEPGEADVGPDSGQLGRALRSEQLTGRIRQDAVGTEPERRAHRGRDAVEHELSVDPGAPLLRVRPHFVLRRIEAERDHELARPGLRLLGRGDPDRRHARLGCRSSGLDGRLDRRAGVDVGAGHTVGSERGIDRRIRRSGLPGLGRRRIRRRRRQTGIRTDDRRRTGIPPGALRIGADRQPLRVGRAHGPAAAHVGGLLDHVALHPECHGERSDLLSGHDRAGRPLPGSSGPVERRELGPEHVVDGEGGHQPGVVVHRRTDRAGGVGGFPCLLGRRTGVRRGGGERGRPGDGRGGRRKVAGGVAATSGEHEGGEGEGGQPARRSGRELMPIRRPSDGAGSRCLDLMYEQSFVRVLELGVLRDGEVRRQGGRDQRWCTRSGPQPRRALAREGARIALWDIANGQNTRPPYRMASADDMAETVRLVEREGTRCCRSPPTSATVKRCRTRSRRRWRRSGESTTWSPSRARCR